MKFPDSPREGSVAHDDARDRLEAAAQRERHVRREAETATGTSGEPGAASELAEAQDQLAAREAWVKWIERGY